MTNTTVSFFLPRRSLAALDEALATLADAGIPVQRFSTGREGLFGRRAWAILIVTGDAAAFATAITFLRLSLV